MITFAALPASVSLAFRAGVTGPDGTPPPDRRRSAIFPPFKVKHPAQGGKC